MSKNASSVTASHSPPKISSDGEHYWLHGNKRTQRYSQRQWNIKESQPLQLTLQRFTFNNAAKVSISFETAMPAHRLLRILNLKALLSRSDKAVIIR